MDFASLKKNRGNFETLTAKMKEDKGGFSKKDDGFWKLKVDDSGNGYAVIRFLTAPPGEDFPYVQLFTQSFKGPTGKWYIENSLSTIGQDDPVTEHFFAVRGDGSDPVKKEAARPFTRKTNYISNILVISDPKNPENEGKVFKYSYGPRIYQKIEGAMYPEFEDEVAFNPFDLWTGANFKLKARMLNGQRSYDKSEFEKPEALFEGDDAALETLWNSLPSLKEEVAADKFKSYDDLKKKLEMVLDIKNDSVRPSRTPEPTRVERSEPEDVPSSSDDDDDQATLEKYKALLADD